MQFLLDTNALHRDYFLTKPAVVALAREQSRGGYAVIVPEVVVQEHMKHFREDRKELISAFTEYAHVTTTDLAPSLLYPPTETYPDVLRARLAELSIRVAPHPAASHADVVARAVGGRLPFFGDGQQGYNDVLIWETALELCRSDQVILVSKDKRAFGPDRLDSELERELSALSLQV